MKELTINSFSDPCIWQLYNRTVTSLEDFKQLQCNLDSILEICFGTVWDKQMKNVDLLW